jgi:hypothetical protein
MKIPKLFIPSSRRLRGVRAVASAGEAALPSLFYMFLDSFVNILFFRRIAPVHTATKRGQHAEKHCMTRLCL